MKKRHKILASLSGMAVASGAFVILESMRELSSLTVRNVKISYNKDSETKPVRIAYFADYHEAVGGKMNSKIANAITMQVGEGPSVDVSAGAAEMAGFYADLYGTADKMHISIIAIFFIVFMILSSILVFVMFLCHNLAGTCQGEVNMVADVF